MAYEVLEPELTVDKSLGYVEDEKGNKFHNITCKTYFKGDVISDTDIAPYIIEAYKNGDEHTRSILKKLGESKPKSKTKSKVSPKAKEKE